MRDKPGVVNAARHSTSGPNQKQQDHSQTKEPHNLKQRQRELNGQGWDDGATSPYQNDSSGANGQVKGDGDAPPQGNPTAAAVAEGPHVLLEEQDEAVALLVQVNERYEKKPLDIEGGHVQCHLICSLFSTGRIMAQAGRLFKV